MVVVVVVVVVPLDLFTATGTSFFSLVGIAS